MGEKKKRVTRLDRVRVMLVEMKSTATAKRAAAAMEGRYKEAITHQDYETEIAACLGACDERSGKGG